MVIKSDLEKILWDGLDWIYLAKVRIRCREIAKNLED